MFSLVLIYYFQVKPFSCDQCDYTAGQKASLITHINSVHENNRPYVCELCGYKTASPSTLNAHKRMVHEKQRPFVCETCGYSSPSKVRLNGHIYKFHSIVCYNTTHNFSIYCRNVY